MIILNLGVLFAVLSDFPDTSVQGLALDTYNGVQTVVTPTYVRVFLNNQSDYFFFEVKSCGKVNVTLIDEYSPFTIKLALSERANDSMPYDCYKGTCSPLADSFSAGDYCSGSKAFWVQRSIYEGTPELYFGEGCTAGIGNLTRYPVSWTYTIYLDPPFSKMELSTNGTATWKLGSSVCQPATTTVHVAPTTTSLVPCPSGKNGGSSTSVLSLMTTLLIYVSASL